MHGFRWPWSSSTAPEMVRNGVEVNLTGLAQYVSSGDERQNAVDLMPGWNCALPPEAGVNAGAGALFNDDRILWAIEKFGGIGGRSVLEIGPMEASHTYMLEKAGALVQAVEANKLAFLKCLIAKEILGLNARFALAETNEWLRKSTSRYDLIVACGVLYHMRDPVTFLELLARRANAIFIWTHVVDLEPGSDEGNPPSIVEQRHGHSIRLYKKPYQNAPSDPAFCGGVFDEPHWMPAEDILKVLTALGFDKIDVIGPSDHPNQAAMSIFARKTRE
jgi:hypothetical protein